MKKISDLILFNDHHLIAFNKPAGLPTQQDQTGDASLHRMAMAYAHRDLYIVHRLDRRVSGLVLFGKTRAATADLTAQWNNKSVEKIYFGLVPKMDIPVSGTLHHYLTYDAKQNITTAHDTPQPESDEAELSYEVFAELDNFLALRIKLITGRKHQIRAQLAAIGCPLRGDVKYGSKRTNPDTSIDLHARSITLKHPTKNISISIVAPFPEGGLWSHLPLEIGKA